MQGASTMRNAVKRVTHKERSQPKARKRFGLLEKHKDYVERANDFKKKKASIKTLKKKAADRNPDEFYHNMHNSQVTNGVHNAKRDGSLNNSTVQLLKTQDMGYIVYRKSIDDRKVEALKENLHMIGENIPRKHKIFVDDRETLEAFDVAKHFDTAPEFVGRFFNRPRVETIEKMVHSAESKSTTTEQMHKNDGKTRKSIQRTESPHSSIIKIKESYHWVSASEEFNGERHEDESSYEGSTGRNWDRRESCKIWW